MLVNNRLVLKITSIVVTIGTTIFLGACGGGPESKDINIDGSSTVYPITKAVADAYNKQATTTIKVNVEFSGTGGGFKKFCDGKTDISNASRPILQKEIDACKAKGINYIELPVAFDALSIIVNRENSAVTNITLEELKKLWEPAAEKKITRWNQIRSTWPDQPIKLFGPGKDSGTFDYFTEAVTGTLDASRTDYVASEDDDVIAKGVAQDKEALGYFGLAYYEKYKDAIRVVPVDAGNGPIEPSVETVVNNQYKPLARPLFIYINANSVQTNPAVARFVDFYMSEAVDTIKSVGYIPLPDEAYVVARGNLHKLKMGTVFGGKSEFDLSISDLLRKKTDFQEAQASPQP